MLILDDIYCFYFFIHSFQILFKSSAFFLIMGLISSVFAGVQSARAALLIFKLI